MLGELDHPDLESHTSTGEEKYGFIVYRTYYSDYEAWDRFMVYLNAQVRSSMESEGMGHAIPYVDWKVQSSPELNNASDKEVRRRFNEWVDSREEPVDNSARFRACVVVNRDCMNDVMAIVEVLEEDGEPMDEYDYDGLAWVHLVSKNESEGSVRVCISNLMPRTFNLVPYNWEEIARDGNNQPRQ